MWLRLSIVVPLEICQWPPRARSGYTAMVPRYPQVAETPTWSCHFPPAASKPRKYLRHWVDVMRCLVCGGQMELVDHAPWEPQLASSGLERHTLKCRDCGDLELRLVFGHYRVDAGATQDDMAGPFCGSPTDVGQQQDTALPADPISVSLADRRQRRDAAPKATPISVSSTDCSQQKDAAPRAELIIPPPVDRGQQKGAAIPKAFERRLQQRAVLVGQQKQAALPTEPLSISPADINGQKHVATPNAWARAIHGLQQRPEALVSPAGQQEAGGRLAPAEPTSTPPSR